MSPAFVITFWLIVGAITGVAIALFLTLIVIPSYYSFRNMPRRKRTVKGFRKLALFSLLVTAGVLGGAAVGVWPAVHAMMYSDDFEQYAGLYDTVRAPLCYPYELVATDGAGSATLQIWPADSLLLANVARLQQIERYLLGATAEGRDGARSWFILDCDRGEMQKFVDESLFNSAARIQGITSRPDLKPISEQFFTNAPLLGLTLTLPIVK